MIETIQSLRFTYPEQPALAQLRKPFGMLPDIDSLFLKWIKKTKTIALTYLKLENILHFRYDTRKLSQ